ncbi:MULTISPECIES: type II CRISPR-associated endonuclease Cas1 [Prevotella]|jgi:CRISPR-associated endonuclease cas1, NMENI subtype|uniref:type II CRISPR-associated endonuclease Cas1 n=1 Tax=Prevotella TaxID=838 RepID=UPI001CB29BE1|nr:MULTISPECIES: type II CRISPR-associated endonuclease Cas1 [Prevotella]MBF1581248.1 type II CRISPR-associated endonuclease Cas1 [Prevotella sp.]
MIKKTLYFGNPAYLSLRNGQLVIRLPEVEKAELPDIIKQETIRTVPIEDIGVVVLDNKQITITQGALAELVANSAAVITCDSKCMPTGMLLPLSGNTLYQERFRNQIEAAIPLRKQLWQQTVKAKIENQAYCLQKNTSKSFVPLHVLARKVRSDDADNHEAQAAAYYWKNLFSDGFTRDKDGIPPNNLLNYGYAILRAVIARALVGSGLLPVYGIHHHNRYNAYCLADDIMEPYRPFVDDLVISTMKKMEVSDDLTVALKREMLSIPVLDVVIGGKRSPLMIAAGLTTASLAKCYNGEAREISYPSFL